MGIEPIQMNAWEPDGEGISYKTNKITLHTVYPFVMIFSKIKMSLFSYKWHLTKALHLQQNLMTDIQYYIKKENDLKSLNFDARGIELICTFFSWNTVVQSFFPKACLNFVYATPTCIIAEVGTSIIAEVGTSAVFCPDSKQPNPPPLIVFDR